MDIGKFQDAVFLTPIAGSSAPLKLLDKAIELYQTQGISGETLGKIMYALALVCNTYDYDLNDEAISFLYSAVKFLNNGEDDAT